MPEASRQLIIITSSRTTAALYVVQLIKQRYPQTQKAQQRRHKARINNQLIWPHHL